MSWEQVDPAIWKITLVWLKIETQLIIISVDQENYTHFYVQDKKFMNLNVDDEGDGEAN